MTQDLLIDYINFRDYVDITRFIFDAPKAGAVNFNQDRLREFRNKIRNFQNTNLPALICLPLYKELVSQKAQGTLTDLNLELLYGSAATGGYDFSYRGIEGYLVMGVYKEYLRTTNFKSTRQGIVKQQSDNAELATPEELEVLIRNIDGIMQAYKSDVTVYLDKNKSSYPLYDCKDCNSSGRGWNVTSIKANPNSKRPQTQEYRGDSEYLRIHKYLK